MSEALRSQRLRFVLCCQHQDYKVLGLDCMKMWPWMRDLPTSVWAGHGWAFDENGLRRSHPQAAAMPCKAWKSSNLWVLHRRR